MREPPLGGNTPASMSTSAWGHPDRHYAAEQMHHAAQRRPGESDAGRWAKVLEQASPGIRDSVERTSKQWNGILRDYLRNETALRLTVGDAAQAVPVRVVDGMPLPFTHAISELNGLEQLLLHRPTIEATAAGTRFMATQVDDVRDIWPDLAGPSGRDEFERVQQTAQAWLKQLDKVQAIEKLIGINEDVLGAYFYRVPEIRLYWVVIGIIARALGISAEALTVVVLAHELAHAYTHLGRDIDSQRWDTNQFARAHLDIVEGLAQFYTSVLCQRLEQRMPAALAAYKVLLAKQSGPYRAHEAWVKDHPQAGEVIRVSMIECRSQGITDAKEFEAAIKKYREGIRGTKPRPGKQQLFGMDE